VQRALPAGPQVCPHTVAERHRSENTPGSGLGTKGEMMWYLVELEYIPGAFVAVRARHRTYLAGLARDGKLGFAGRFGDDSGSVFLYGPGTEQELQEWMDNDPYVLEGVIARRTVRPFVPGVAFGLPPADHYE
jgi:uncharacterized protein